MRRRPRLPARLATALAGALALGLVPAAPQVAVAATVASPPAAADAPRFRDAHGIRVVSAEPDGDRLVRLVVATAALERPVRVNVLLPAAYDDNGRRYPSLYLFHGTSGGADDWLQSGDVAATTADRRMVTVMPDAGYHSNGGSWFTDWVDQETELGAAEWERFHTAQLVPWIDANLHTVDARSGRAVAGLSQGGFGAYTYASRHPDLFVAAAAFSGVPDIARNPAAKSAASVVISGTMTGLNGVQPYAPFGDPVADDIIWQGHNPATLVGNLRHTDLRLWCGNGAPGPLDDPAQPNPGATVIEQFTYDSTTFFTQAADAENVDHVFRDYGAGTHTWPYWSRDLRQWMPRLAKVFAQDRADPARISYRSIEKTWREWGWRVATRRTAEHAWSGLEKASRGGFTLTGGRAVVTTPGDYRPGRAYVLRYRAGKGPERVVAGERGRLRLRVTPSGSDPVRVTVRAAA
ncbi:MAG: alpha/beta hydrolase [Nocardioides sp.]